MRITLVNAPVTVRSEHSRLTLPLGLAYIGAALMSEGHPVSAVDFNVSGLDERRVDRIVDVDRPSLVGISAMTETYPNALTIARGVKAKDPSVVVVMGGAHPTILPEEVLAEEAVDFVVVGAGERTMAELAAYLDRGEGRLEDIAGLGYRRDGVLHTNERGPLPHPDDLPRPARGLFPIDFYKDKFNVLTATGSCPYRCPFCSAAAIWEGRRKMRSPESIVDELEALIEEYGAFDFFFTDDIFTLNKAWVYRLLDALGGLSRPITWGCATRVDLVDAELLGAMAASGCRAIQFGVESGSETILDSVKGISKAQVLTAVSGAVGAGIDVVSSFMVPFPEDTIETLRDTGEFMKVVHEAGSRILLSYTAPYPGTQFHTRAEELGLTILTDKWDEFDAKHLVIETKHLPASEIDAAVADIVRDIGLCKSTA